MLTRQQKFIIELAQRGAHIEEILFDYMNVFYKEFPASRINSIINKLQSDYLVDRIYNLEHIRDVANERAAYLGAYLEGNLYTDEETARACAPVQLDNVRAILDACSERARDIWWTHTEGTDKEE